MEIEANTKNWNGIVNARCQRMSANVKYAGEKDRIKTDSSLQYFNMCAERDPEIQRLERLEKGTNHKVRLRPCLN